jgi:hypothetical protein
MFRYLQGKVVLPVGTNAGLSLAYKSVKIDLPKGIIDHFPFLYHLMTDLYPLEKTKGHAHHRHGPDVLG